MNGVSVFAEFAAPPASIDELKSRVRDALRDGLRLTVTATFEIGNASILKDGRAVFNIGGNKYRIVVWINYPYRVVYVRFIGTHRQYDAIDAQTI